MARVRGRAIPCHRFGRFCVRSPFALASVGRGECSGSTASESFLVKPLQGCTANLRACRFLELRWASTPSCSGQRCQRCVWWCGQRGGFAAPWWWGHEAPSTVVRCGFGHSRNRQGGGTSKRPQGPPFTYWVRHCGPPAGHPQNGVPHGPQASPLPPGSLPNRSPLAAGHTPPAETREAPTSNQIRRGKRQRRFSAAQMAPGTASANGPARRPSAMSGDGGTVRYSRFAAYRSPSVAHPKGLSPSPQDANWRTGAFCTLPERMQRVHTLSRRTPPLTLARTRCRFGRHTRLVLLLA